MTLLLIISFVIPMILSISFTPLVIRFAKSIGATDKPDPRKIHTTIIPRIGGLSIFLSIAISLSLVAWLYPSFTEIFQNHFTQTLVLAGCFLGVFFLGFWDDIKPLKPGVKFGIQFIIAGVIYFAGFKISNITNPLGGGLLNVELIDFPLTLLWIVGITNAFNLIDGLDGLAAGVSIIAVITLFAVALQENRLIAPMLAVLLAGSCSGFLKYNFNPAQVFMGDTGSMFIGYIIAAVSITGALKSAAAVTIFVPMLALAVPILDTTFAIIRRVFNDRPIGEADHGHIHHRLLAIGMNQKEAVIAVYIISSFLGATAFIINGIKFDHALIVFISVILIILYGAKKIGIFSVELPKEGCSLEDG